MDAHDVSKRTRELLAQSKELRRMTNVELERSRIAVDQSRQTLHRAGNILNRIGLRQQLAARRAARVK